MGKSDGDAGLVQDGGDILLRADGHDMDTGAEGFLPDFSSLLLTALRMTAARAISKPMISSISYCFSVPSSGSG